MKQFILHNPSGTIYPYLLHPELDSNISIYLKGMGCYDFRSCEIITPKTLTEMIEYYFISIWRLNITNKKLIFTLVNTICLNRKLRYLIYNFI